MCATGGRRRRLGRGKAWSRGTKPPGDGVAIARGSREVDAPVVGATIFQMRAGFVRLFRVRRRYSVFDAGWNEDGRFVLVLEFLFTESEWFCSWI